MDRQHRFASLALGAIALCMLVSNRVCALDVNVVGLFPNKAVVQIDGGSLQTMAIGQKVHDDVVLLSVGRDGATFDIEGRRVSIPLGAARRQATSPSLAANYAVVPADARGDLVTNGEVNGVPVRFAVDTGATFITFPAREAVRLGLDYRNGRKVVMETANGEAFAYRLKLDTVRIGNVAVHDVEAVVTEGNSLPIALLGMSFLNRLDMKREGTTLTLTKRD